MKSHAREKFAPVITWAWAGAGRVVSRSAGKPRAGVSELLLEQVSEFILQWYSAAAVVS